MKFIVLLIIFWNFRLVKYFIYLQDLKEHFVKAIQNELIKFSEDVGVGNIINLSDYAKLY